MSQSFSPTAGMQNGFDIARVNELNTREREIVSRRESLLGPSYKLMYEHPVEFVRGEGVFLYDAEDNAYLDCYNNVPSVGHCNPAVVEAVSSQIATLNTHTRYMSENILNYSEQLLNTFEPELGHVMYTCTGSEAVDLSLRIAKFYTGGTGIIVTDYAYHGITTTVAAISTTMGKYVPVDQHVRTVRAPDAYRAGEGVDVAQRLADDIEAAIADMARHGIKFAGFIADSIFSTDGLLTTPAGFLKKRLMSCTSTAAFTLPMKCSLASGVPARICGVISATVLTLIWWLWASQWVMACQSQRLLPDLNCWQILAVKFAISIPLQGIRSVLLQHKPY